MRVEHGGNLWAKITSQRLDRCHRDLRHTLTRRRRRAAYQQQQVKPLQLNSSLSCV